MIDIRSIIFDWNAWTAVGTVSMALATFVVVLQARGTVRTTKSGIRIVFGPSAP
jgi:hypothetical protein